MIIQPIVEGYGEVSAFPVLLRRLRDETGAFHIEFGSPIRRKRPQLVNEAALRQAIELALLRPQCDGILILFDGDEDCPKHLGPQVQAWAQAAARNVPCAVVIAKCEYEAWFLAAMESLRDFRGVEPNASSHPAPESVRDAKGWLEARMTPRTTYSPTFDQAAFSERFDLASAHRSSRSFRRLVKAFGLIVSGGGVALAEWPPRDWT
ncbi:MAG: DUF4276 family protein [Acidobacteria bacterium]|nr:DUF4276 family protein [Acidobacteriota bacterium]